MVDKQNAVQVVGFMLDHAGQQAVRFHFLSGKAFSSGIETHAIEKHDVRVYSAAKTVVDCFKFRNKIGIDIAIEALRAYHAAEAEVMARVAADQPALRQAGLEVQLLAELHLHSRDLVVLELGRSIGNHLEQSLRSLHERARGLGRGSGLGYL